MNFFKRSFTLIIVFAVVSGWGSAMAQSGHYSAASLGMGGTGTAYLDTYHANFVNPANLMLNSDSKPSTSIGFLGGISATAGGPLANISVYNDYFTTGGVVNSQEALNAWFGTEAGNSRRLGMELDIIPLAGSYRTDNMSFSLALRNRTLVSSSMNKGYARLLLSGISQDAFGDQTPVDFASKGVVFSEVSAGFSYKLLELPSLPGIGENVKLFVGAAPKFIIPHHTSSIDFNSTLEVNSDEIVHDFQYTFKTVGLASQFQEYYEASQAENFDGSLGDFIEPGADSFVGVQGTGFGIDLGGTIEMDLAGPLKSVFSWAKGPKKLRVGLSITDIGSISYQENAGSFSADETFTWDGVDFNDGFDEAFADSLANQIYLNYEPGNEEEIVEKLPTKVNLGAQLKLGKLGFAFDLQKGLNEAGMNSERVALGVGLEYKLLNIIPLRAGYRTGGLTSSSFTFGTGIELRNFELTLAGLTVPNSRNRGTGIGGAWSGLVFRF